MAHKFLTFAQLRRDPALQSRVQMDPEVVEDYKNAILGGEKLPRVSVVFDGMYYYLVDGWHRAAATEAAGKSEIEAESVDGDYRAALLTAMSANGKNGARRTNGDKQKAILALLNDLEWSKWSNTAIAKQLRVSDHTVEKVRSSLRICEVTSDSSLNESVSEDPHSSDRPRTYITKHGTEAVMKTANIGKAARADSPNLVAVETSKEPEAQPDDEDPFGGFDANEELVAALEENQALNIQLDALSADDTGAQLLKEVRIRQGIEARLSQEMETNKRQDKELRWFGKQFEELRKILGIDSNSRVVSAVKALLRKEVA